MTKSEKNMTIQDTLYQKSKIYMNVFSKSLKKVLVVVNRVTWRSLQKHLRNF